LARPSGSLIYLETIRDKTGGASPPLALLEQVTVLHEIGHQFLLQHEDGHWPPSDSSTNGADDFIMTDNTDQNGIPANLTFGPVCIDKIRNKDYPR